MKGRLKRTKSRARVAAQGFWPVNPLHQRPRGEHGSRLRRPSFCFHVAYLGSGSRAELNDFLGIWRHEP